ncbi:MAG: hypothetical protein H0U74_21750 [Bradymonadaceae bacterium]|nr:hypothetical protein [Lujinxingiaceae bacterium]
MSVEFERKPLDIAAFAANLQRHIDPAAPPPLKMMAARGMVPAPPDQQLKVLYQLHFDEAVSVEVLKALHAMPENILLPAVQGDQPASVLDWVASERDGAVVDAVVLHKNTDDRTIAHLAKTADANLCDLISNNQVRVLRYPTIIEHLYKNTSARMATVDKLVDLAKRNDVEIPNLAGLKSVLESEEDLSEGLLDDDEFAALLKEEAAKVKSEDAQSSSMEELTRGERERLREQLDQEDEEKVTKGGGTLHSKILQMSIAQKVRLSTVGSKEAINILVRDSNKLIHMAAIRSPRLNAPDVKKLAGNKSMPEGVVRYIANNRDWTRHYEVMVLLVSNPKTPLPDVMGFLNHLRSKELRDLSRSKNVPQQVSRMAKTLATKRSGG